MACLCLFLSFASFRLRTGLFLLLCIFPSCFGWPRNEHKRDIEAHTRTDTHTHTQTRTRTDTDTRTHTLSHTHAHTVRLSKKQGLYCTTVQNKNKETKKPQPTSHNKQTKHYSLSKRMMHASACTQTETNSRREHFSKKRQRREQKQKHMTFAQHAAKKASSATCACLAHYCFALNPLLARPIACQVSFVSPSHTHRRARAHTHTRRRTRVSLQHTQYTIEPPPPPKQTYTASTAANALGKRKKRGQQQERSSYCSKVRRVALTPITPFALFLVILLLQRLDGIHLVLQAGQDVSHARKLLISSE